MPLPEPSLEAKLHQEKFAAHLKQKIQAEGSLSFWRFMEQALYAPGLGYYAAGAQKFGAEGDFVTAPELHPLFAKTLVNAFLPTLKNLSEKNILEFGAGSGQLACDILQALEEQHALPDHYFIVEISPDLIARQKKYLSEKLPGFVERVAWLSELPQKFCGIILGNEVLDAMPVHIFHFENSNLLEQHVTLENNQFTTILKRASTELEQACAHILPQLPTHLAYQSEVSTFIPGFIHSLGDMLEQGLILLIDYGFSRAEYYHPDRHMGTLMCHYQHHAHTDPLILLGLQDITAHVDFTLVAESADRAGLEVLGFHTQAGFLLNAGMMEIYQALPEAEKLRANLAVKLLTLPHEMGELFKVIALGKNVACPRGFHHDRLHIL